MANRPRWTVSVLTIPGREAYLEQLLGSLRDVDLPAGTVVDVVYNSDTRELPLDIARRIRRMGRGMDVRAHFNAQDPSIGTGRVQQLNHGQTPLIAFIDDDLTLHGEVFEELEAELQGRPVGIVGVRSYVEGTDRLFKPRPTTPSVEVDGFRFMPVQGMLVAGYRRLFLDVGGFNPRRRFWGEWTELNLRMWRSGFPTGYGTGESFLRHWEQAPHSPTRSLMGRQDHVLWGLMCTALEYEAAVETPDTQAFWDLVESRYIAYAFGSDVTIRHLLRSAIRLAPRLATEYPSIVEFRDTVRQHPFTFMPFHRLTEDEVAAVVQHASDRIAPYRAEAWRRRVTHAA